MLISLTILTKRQREYVARESERKDMSQAEWAQAFFAAALDARMNPKSRWHEGRQSLELDEQ